MGTEMAGSSRLRTSDDEREQVAAILRAAVAEGRLSLTDGDERLARTYEAVYRDELRPLTADLPNGGWDALARTPEALDAARRGLRRHASLVALAAGLLPGPVHGTQHEAGGGPDARPDRGAGQGVPAGPHR